MKEMEQVYNFAHVKVLHFLKTPLLITLGACSLKLNGLLKERYRRTLLNFKETHVLNFKEKLGNASANTESADL